MWMPALWDSLVFFFQAEDGIRDYKVTGVQTCALPIYLSARQFQHPRLVADVAQALEAGGLDPCYLELEITEGIALDHSEDTVNALREIGRASCRERV